MFPRGSLHRWKAFSTADGTVFFPPEGKQVAAIHVRERIRPLEPIQRIARQLQSSIGSVASITPTGEVEKLETVEREYGARIELTGTHTSGQPFRYLLGCVFGDDFYDRIDAFFIGESPTIDDYRALAGDFILKYRLNLGETRARRYHYTPPAGWQGRARGMLAQWFTYDFPKRPSQLLVAASFPSGRREASVMSRVMLTRRMLAFRTDQMKTESFTHAGGLEAQLLHRHGRFPTTYRYSNATDLLTAVLTDQFNVYVVRLETGGEWFDADRATLLELVQSIRPLPRRTVETEKLLSWMVVD